MKPGNDHRPEEAKLRDRTDRGTSSFFIGIIHNGNDEKLKGTINSILKQNYSGTDLVIHVFYAEDGAPSINLTSGQVTFLPFGNKEDFFRKFISAVDKSNAAYYLALYSGEQLFEHALDSAARIFNNYFAINWLTGIQTFRSNGDFNVVFGNTSTRRWNRRIYEHNLYLNSARYIPPAATFWRRDAWDTARTRLYFVSLKNFCDDLWLAFFKVQRLYTCKVYFSSSSNYDKTKLQAVDTDAQYRLVEDKWLNRVTEFFFINNVPYLRVFYRTRENLSPVVRFDHNSEIYFLSEY